MSGINNYCFTALGNHEQNLCNAKRYGGSPAFALIETDAGILDYSSAAQWNTAIAADKAHIIKGVMLEYPPATPIKTDNNIACGPDQTLDGFTHVLNIISQQVNEHNNTFWENANGRTFWIAWIECKNDIIRVVEDNAVITVTPANTPKKDTEVQLYNITIEWTSLPNEFPQEWAVPTAIFDL